MKISKNIEGSKLTAVFSGRLDTMTTPEAEKELQGALDKITELVLDFEAIDYISSSGLRLLLSLQKQMNAKNGTMVIRNINETVSEIFEVTGFSDILTVE